MPEIRITVENKIAVAEKDAEIVCDNSDYVAVFCLDEEWKEHDLKTMVVSWGEEKRTIVFTGDTAEIPVITDTARVAIGIFAGNIRTSTSAVVKCRRSARSDGGTPTEPPEDIYNQLIELIESLGGASTDKIAAAVAEYLTENPIEESDPTVPDWAREAKKPSYNAKEVGALPDTTVIPTVPDNISAFRNDAGFVTGSEVDEKIKQSVSGSITQETDPTVPAWAKSFEKPTYTATEVGADPTGTASSAVSAHNVNGDAHNDIRLLIGELTRRFNALADSENIDLDQLSEIIEYIQDNRELIDTVTTSKISFSDIIDNVTTNASGKPLSAAQGVFLKGLIDAITVPTALSELSDDAEHRTVTDAEKAAWNAKSTFSGNYNDLENKPKMPTVPSAISAFTNDAGYAAISKNTFASGDTISTPTGYSEYRAAAAVSELTITYPTGDFETWVKFTTSASGDIAITLPENTMYINGAPEFGNGETWELSIKDGIAVAAMGGN